MDRDIIPYKLCTFTFQCWLFVSRYGDMNYSHEVLCVNEYMVQLLLHE